MEGYFGMQSYSGHSTTMIVMGRTEVSMHGYVQWSFQSFRFHKISFEC